MNDLKQGSEAIKERARMEMVKKNETFFQVIEPSHDKAAPRNPTAH